ncbi:hypothetical protein ACHAXT_006616 [Thalassiosira profunda]
MMKQIVANAVAKGGEPGPGVGAGRASTAGSDARLGIHHKVANAPAPSLLPTTGPAKAAKEKHRHTLAVLVVVPRSTSARIANEAVLEQAISITTDRLSVSLRANASEPCSDNNNSGATLAEMRRYTSDVYEMVWDSVVESFADRGKLLDLVVYPQGLPNICPESVIALSPDLSCICSHESGIIARYEERATDVNAWRALTGMEPLQVLQVDGLPGGAEIARDPNVVFLEDDNDSYAHTRIENDSSVEEKKEDSNLYDMRPNHQTTLYSSVCIGGTFDGMHYGHRKLLTLAISSVNPIDGALSVGVKRDEMLSGKKFASLIPPLEKRISGVLDFVRKLAPSMTNRVRCEPMDDASLQDWLLRGDFDALVVSSDTLPLGWRLNKYRQSVLGLDPVHLLCSQRTTAHGMSARPCES